MKHPVSPRSGAEWARSVEQRLRNNGSAIRLGNWVLANVDEQLVFADSRGNVINLTAPLKELAEPATRGFLTEDSPLPAQNLVSLDSLPILSQVQELVDSIYEGVTHALQSDNPISALIDVLRNIPTINVLGYGGGAANIGETHQNEWDQLISGWVGQLGTGAVLSDLFTVGYQLASNAAKGLLSFDILGIRNNKPLEHGLSATGISSFNMSRVAFETAAPVLPLTSSATLGSFMRIPENTARTSIAWHGSGNANITDFRIMLWRLDPVTGAKSIVHTSSNQSGLLPAATANPPKITYALPAAVDVVAGENYLAEFALVGTGTHNIVGQTTWMPNDSAVFPRRWGLSRTAGVATFPPASPIADASVAYSGKTPFWEFGNGAASPPAPHADETKTFTASGTYDVPGWCAVLDVILAPAGGGGQACGLLWGEGGHTGDWVAITLVRGVHIPVTTLSLDVTIGEGGGGGGGFGDGGEDGASTQVSGVGITTIIAAGGTGGSAGNASIVGDSLGDFTYNGVPYAGGRGGVTAGASGGTPGGAGAGATIIGLNAGKGGRGRVWIVARQS